MIQRRRRMRYLSDVSTGMGSALVNSGLMDSPLAHVCLQVASHRYFYLPVWAELNSKLRRRAKASEDLNREVGSRSLIDQLEGMKQTASGAHLGHLCWDSYSWANIS
jgi:hypothetical protein